MEPNFLVLFSVSLLLIPGVSLVGAGGKEGIQEYKGLILSGWKNEKIQVISDSSFYMYKL